MQPLVWALAVMTRRFSLVTTCHDAAGVNGSLGRGELRQHVETLAATLVASGINPGDAVSIAETNTASMRWTLTFFHLIDVDRQILCPLHLHSVHIGDGRATRDCAWHECGSQPLLS